MAQSLCAKRQKLCHGADLFSDFSEDETDDEILSQVASSDASTSAEPTSAEADAWENIDSEMSGDESVQLEERVVLDEWVEVNESDDEDHRWWALGPDGPGQFLLLLDLDLESELEYYCPTSSARLSCGWVVDVVVTLEMALGRENPFF